MGFERYLEAKVCSRCWGTFRMLTGSGARELRTGAGMTMRAFCRGSGFSPTYVSKVELGEGKMSRALERAYLERFAPEHVVERELMVMPRTGRERSA